jgi:DNA-binding transcriptional regulator YhcF (GntR family)
MVSIIHNISYAKLKMNDKIPAINLFHKQFLLSQNTVEKAYTILTDRKVIVFIRGRGNNLARTGLISKVYILLFA